MAATKEEETIVKARSPAKSREETTQIGTSLQSKATYFESTTSIQLASE
jgi:hypothetical protein